MDILGRLYLIAPESEEICLKNQRLTSIEAEMTILKQFRQLRHLDISQNQLKTLTGEMTALERLVALDISGNQFTSIQDILPVLQKLPSLKSLSVTLCSKEDEQLVLVTLPKLRILNASPLSSFGEKLVINSPFEFHRAPDPPLIPSKETKQDDTFSSEKSTLHSSISKVYIYMSM